MKRKELTRAVALQLQDASESSEGMDNTPGGPDSIRLQWGLKIYITNKFPDDADVAASRTTFESSWIREWYRKGNAEVLKESVPEPNLAYKILL